MNKSEEEIKKEIEYAQEIIANIFAGENKKCSQRGYGKEREYGKECGYFCVSCERKFRFIMARVIHKAMEESRTERNKEVSKAIKERIKYNSQKGVVYGGVIIMELEKLKSRLGLGK